MGHVKSGVSQKWNWVDLEGVTVAVNVKGMGESVPEVDKGR